MMTFICGLVCGIFLAVATAFIGFIIFNGDEESLCECEITQGKVFASTDIRRYPIDVTTNDEAWIKIEVSEKKLVISIDRLSTALYGDELGAIGEVMRMIFGNDPKRNGADCGDYLEELDRDSKQFELNGQEMLRIAESHNKQDDEWRRKLNVISDERDYVLALLRRQIKTSNTNSEIVHDIKTLIVPKLLKKIEFFKQHETSPRLFYEDMLNIITKTATPQSEGNDHGEAKPVEDERTTDEQHDHDEHTGSGPVG